MKHPSIVAPLVPHVVIVGAGFGGLYAARALKRARVRITIIDRRNHHLFQPLLYQVATASLNPSEIAKPIRSILRRQRNAQVLLADAKAIHPTRKIVELTDGELSYDFLILATGATHAYFGNDHWRDHAPGLKTVEDALDIRRRVLLAYEAAEREPDATARQALMTFVIVGAGPTGVEMAGALSEIARHTLAEDFRHIDPRQARVVLIEGLDRVLPPFKPELSASAHKQLERLGVTIRLGSRVTAIDADGVSLGEERIPAHTVVWAAGVAASPLAKTLGVPLDRAGRVVVEESLSVPGQPNVWVIGDLAHVESAGKSVPGVAPAAIQMGKHAAANLTRALKGEAQQPFQYRDKGSLATIGRRAAVADLGRFKLSGALAWLAWLFVHILFLIGFKNRLFVLFQWGWSYVAHARGSRLITGAGAPLAPKDVKPGDLLEAAQRP
ncbi:MAG: NAD(P)/FAD-dependent oxidoreductase [Planctomycetota bacterium]